MVYIVVVVSTILLLVANLIVFRTRRPVGKTAGFSLAMAVGPALLAFVMPLAAIQGLVLMVAVVLWRNSGRGPSYFLGLSCGATLIACGVAGCLVWKFEREAAEFRSLYPVESIESRLPLAPRHPHPNQLTAAPALRLDRVEDEIQQDRRWLREIELRIIHDFAVTRFVSSPGFGLSRMPEVSHDWLLASPVGEKPTPREPGPRVTSAWSPGEHEPPPLGDEPLLASMNRESVRNFTFAAAFGYVKDRRHVAGFGSHRFLHVPSSTALIKKNQKTTSRSSKVPETAEGWSVRTLDLVGLLLHDTPVVYVSDELPQMDRLRGAPTRPLDKFEALGLQVLRQGEDLFSSRDGKDLRMLGAIYSTNQCVNCHGCQRGDLLGAFSYTLKRDEL